MADAADLKSVVRAGRAGSTPALGTISRIKKLRAASEQSLTARFGLMCLV